MNDKIEGTIIEHMRKLADMREALSWYFRTSKLWNTIQKHLASNECVLINHPKDHVIRCYRGTGPDITFKNAWLYAKDYSAKPPIEANVYCLEFDICGRR